MAEATKTYVKTLKRHHRLVILVNEAVAEKQLIEIMVANHHIWGGRYNPIIPITDGIISDKWLNLVKYYDPDFIYYPGSIDIDKIKSYTFFNPRQYISYREEDHRFYFPGINIHNLLHENVGGEVGHDRLTLLQYSGNWDMPVIAKEFFKLNFGFQPLYMGEKKWVNQFNPVNIDEKNSTDIVKLLYENRPFFKSALSALHANSVVLDGDNDWKNRKFEWIVYDSDNYLTDLLYYWNRQQYIEPTAKISHVISSRSQLVELSDEPYFIGLIYRLCFSSTFSLVSSTIEYNQLNEIRKLIQAKNINISPQPESIESFPFNYSRLKYKRQGYFALESNLLLGDKDFLKFSNLSFENNAIVEEGVYAIDVIMLRDNPNDQNEIKFPFNTHLHHLVCEIKARINGEHRISIYTDCKSNGTEFKIPSDINIIENLLRFRQKHDELITLPIRYTWPSNSGQKLSAFINLFDQDWQDIDEFLTELFWVNIFRYNSEVKNSAVPKGKGVFSYKDIEQEIDRLFEKYNDELVAKLKRIDEVQLDDETIKRIILRDKKETFQYYIDPNLNYLIKKGGLFIGMRVNCNNCGSNKWYSLSELSDKINCKGCSISIIPDLKSKVYYKLSEIITNNLLNDQVKNGKEYDGNYVVLKTLLSLKNDHRLSISSFIWSPSLNFETDRDNKSWSSDFDILAIQNGRFIIGEAKADSSLFNAKEIKQLIWIANNLYPDIIILACARGNLDNVIQKVTEGITNPNCKVISYNTSKPWYHFRGLFGIPHEKSDE